MNPKHPPGPPMTLGNMRRNGVRRLIAYCLNDTCRHTALIDVSGYPDDIEVPEFGKRAKCQKCASMTNFTVNWPGESGMYCQSFGAMCSGRVWLAMTAPCRVFERKLSSAPIKLSAIDIPKTIAIATAAFSASLLLWRSMWR